MLPSVNKVLIGILAAAIASILFLSWRLDSAKQQNAILAANVANLNLAAEQSAKELVAQEDRFNLERQIMAKRSSSREDNLAELSNKQTTLRAAEDETGCADIPMPLKYIRLLPGGESYNRNQEGSGVSAH